METVTMRCWSWFLSAALLAAVATAPVLAADAPAAAPKADEAKKVAEATAPKPETAAPAPAAPPKPAVDGDLAIMVRECKLTDEQVTKLAEAAVALMAQLADWQKANAEKLATFQKDLEGARQAKDEAALKKLRDEFTPLFQERMKLIVNGQKGMLELLTPEQRTTWIGFQTFRQLMVALAPADVKVEQFAKIREICNAAARDIDAIKDAGEAGTAARLKVRNAVITNLREKVLTAEQWAKLPPEFTENPPAPPAAAMPPAAEPKAAPKDSKAPDAKAPEDKAPAPEDKVPAK